MSASINMPQIYGVPGFGASSTYTPKSIYWGDANLTQFAPAGMRTITGAASRDPSNTANVGVLRPGLLMGKITATGGYAPAIIGVTGEAIDGAETAVTVGATVVTELVRRLGASGTFKLTGPPSAAGTVRTSTVTYSAATGTTITITAIGVAAVYTATAASGTDGGFYSIRVTMPGGVPQTTDPLAWNADTSTVDAALEGLSNIGAGEVAAVYSTGTLTLTFVSAVGDVLVEIVNDTTNDGGVQEGGWTLVHTTTGVNGEFVTGSLIQPVDGSETIITILDTEIVVLDENAESKDAQFARIPIRANIDTAQITNYPADASAKTWVKAALNAVGHHTFNDSI